MVPCPRPRDGRVTSNHSLCKRSFSAASARAAFFAARALLISSFRAFNAGPATWRSSGVILPNSRIFRLTSPFLPTAARRVSSSAASSAAFEMASRYFWRKSSIDIPYFGCPTLLSYSQISARYLPSASGTRVRKRKGRASARPLECLLSPWLMPRVLPWLDPRSRQMPLARVRQDPPILCGQLRYPQAIDR